MLFSGKENVFMCFVAFQKMFRKIFSDVWLCSWKYHRKHIFYLLLTFSRLPNEYIISFIPQNTNKTQKKIIKSGQMKARSRSWSTRSQCRWCRHRAIRGAGDVDGQHGVGDVAISSFFLPSLSLSLSLSLLFSKVGSHLKWKWKRKWFSVVLALKFGQLEMLFSLTEFEVTTKHPIFRKIISGISLKSIQTQPKSQFYH